MDTDRRYDALGEESSEDSESENRDRRMSQIENQIRIPHRSSRRSFGGLRNLDYFPKYFAS